MLDSADDIEILRRGREICEQLQNAANNKSLESVRKLPIVQFKDGDKTKISEAFGKIRKGEYCKDPIILPCDKVKRAYNVCGMCTKGDNCWVRTWEKTISLVSDTGKVIKSVDIDAVTNDMVPHADGNIYISSYNKSIYKLTQECRVKQLRSLKFYPSGLGLLPDSDAMLLCVEGDILKVTLSGKTFQSHLDCSQFVDPYRIAVNSNNYACVTDRGQNKVFFFSPEGKIIATYTGTGCDNLARNCSFVPRGVCCDSYGNFVLVDYSSKMINIVNFHGITLEQFSTTTVSNGYPWSLDIDNLGCLWVGFSDGMICIYRQL